MQQAEERHASGQLTDAELEAMRMKVAAEEEFSRLRLVDENRKRRKWKRKGRCRHKQIGKKRRRRKIIYKSCCFNRRATDRKLWEAGVRKIDAGVKL